MALYEQSDDEKVESIKKWWRENGTAVVFGFAIGVSLLFGWRYWQTYLDQQRQIASTLYEQVLYSLETDDIDHAREVAQMLLSKHSQSPYAVLAALNLAHQDFKEGDLAGSHAHLQWIIDQNNSLPELTHIARLRKAKLLFSQGKLADANRLIAGINVGQFKAAYSELQGDIAVAQGQLDTARQAYASALTDEQLAVKYKELIQMKLDDLGQEKSARIEASIPESAMGNATTSQETLLNIPEPITDSTTSSDESSLIDVKPDNSLANQGDSPAIQIEPVLTKDSPIIQESVPIEESPSIRVEETPTLPSTQQQEN